ncbi:unnamed protein product [Rotaria sp. Silwood1]|nr:unnamed protein product [Rotaria sp. Silwood1]CAF1385709.1 unnamed protein product [Rotaria sp. Silwood1]CAF1387569.1 unnamed protein product [Rotaria sp. Silwood1]CAF3527265.1 unnamed protein product [Rotaria sp. Silwood1]CAF3556075.1 unnamed protein product [Rotaria sp. Silwood1]
MMQTMSFITFIILLQSIVQSSSITLNSNVTKCLSDLVTQEFSSSYNYLQLSSKFGATNAYPGFSSLFIKFSDDDSSKAHDIIKFLTLRKAKLDRLIHTNGIRIRNEITNTLNIFNGLTEARKQNKETWNIVVRCHHEAEKINEANVQDYLETHILEYHIEINKLLADFENRLAQAPTISEKELIIFMLDEELLNTYGDRRQDIFS